MVTLLRLLMLLFAMETAVNADDQTEDEETDDDEEETDDTDDTKDREPTRDEKLKAVHDEAAKWRRKFRDLEAKVAADNRADRLQVSFLKAVLARKEPLDTDSAWTLMEGRGFLDAVTVDEDGTVDDETMAEALAKVLDRYPWLGDGDANGDPDPKPRPPRTGGARKQPDSAQGNGGGDLRHRFPALRRGR
jgi:hypothetical protein